MGNTYPITEEQKAILATYTCERLSADQGNLLKIQKFHSARGQGLVHNLRSFGWEEDQNRSTAYYVIKNAKDQIVMFFSLKCGTLFDPGYVKKFTEEFDETRTIFNNWRLAQSGDEAAQQYMQELRQLLGSQAYFERIKTLTDDYYEKVYMFRDIKADKRNEPNSKIIRVDRSHAAIELVEFCVNDRTKRCWKDFSQNQFDKRRHTMGQVFFWWFIVPKMLEISHLIGCEYAYLFAADRDPDGTLVRYYEEALHFKKLRHLGTIKPYYDMNCFFMGRRLFSVDPDLIHPDEDEDDCYGLEYYRDEFFRHFNLKTDVDDMI